MSVINNVNVQMRPFRGYDDPSLPSAQWFGFGFINGDAGGGTMEVFLVFEPQNQPLSGRVFSLEQYYANRSLSNTASWGLRTVNMDRFDNASGPANWHWGGTFESASGIDRTTNPRDLQLPVFIGGPLNVSSQASLQFFTTNVDSSVLRVAGMGYVWTPRSTLSDGGPQRPQHGLYKA